MAAKKAAAERRIREELGRQEHELAQWLELCDQTETTGADPASLCSNGFQSHTA